MYIVFYIDNYIIQLLFIELFHYFLLMLFFKIPRFKNGFNFLINLKSKTILHYFLFIIGLSIIFIYILLSYSDDTSIFNVFILLISLSVFLFIIIKKSITYFYKHDLLIKDLDETKEDLMVEKEKNEKLIKEILDINKKNHSISHMQKKLQFKLNKLAFSNEMATELDFRSNININNLISDEVFENIPIPLTGNSIIDDMLSYLQSECIENKIDFEISLSGNVFHIINNYINTESLEILLADLIRNSIIAINYSKNKNKSILVRIGIIDGIYGVYVYDSGIEFNIDTLLNLGLKPCSSHLDNGGSGLGFMNIFDSLKDSNSTLHISEIGSPCLENYTKGIAIKFNNSHSYILDSYRIDKIKEVKNNNLYFTNSLCNFDSLEISKNN